MTNTPHSSASPVPAPRILLAAGGTGGHILPAVALAETLREQAPGAQIQFCCGNRPAELQIYRRLGIEPWVLPVPHHRPGMLEKIKFVLNMISACRRARRLMHGQKFDVAVGFGSYVSVPPLLAARLQGARLILHEQNVFAGAANRLLAPLARRIALASELRPAKFKASKTRLVGNPIRSRLLTPPTREEARAFFRLRPEGPVCLVLGGSQGAAGLNRIIYELLGRMSNPDSGAGHWQLLWATGPNHYQEAVDAIKKMELDPARHSLNPFIEEMGKAYAAADVVVARAGALTIAELTALGLPSVLVPLPTAAHNHQARNARALEEASAARVIEQADPQGAEKLETLLTLWSHAPDQLAQMAQAASAQGQPQAAEALARLVLEEAGS